MLTTVYLPFCPPAPVRLMVDPITGEVYPLAAGTRITRNGRNIFRITTAWETRIGRNGMPE
jgi:hypothetical protein